MDGLATLLLQRWAFFGVHRHLGYLSISQLRRCDGLRLWSSTVVDGFSDSML
ncbi:uncharacterized protein G2W53_032394 [Senna tora]|uniref:Uncharacterized protein n=1 Tax=Senna tora TaxID=362788 RepID=A0A834SVW8_9FABA|nr:uncharacterized protein G2W53_032394 [Senna tora]